MIVASFGTVGRSWSVTARHWAVAAWAVSWAKAVAMKAETTRRPLFPAWARAFLWKCTRQRCQVALRTCETATLMPFVGIRDHQLHAAQTAAGQLAQKLGPDRLGLGGPDFQPQNLAPTVCVDTDAMITATDTILPPRRTLR
jgi:hypothetical protein